MGWAVGGWRVWFKTFCPDEVTNVANFVRLALFTISFCLQLPPRPLSGNQRIFFTVSFPSDNFNAQMCENSSDGDLKNSTQHAATFSFLAAVATAAATAIFMSRN